VSPLAGALIEGIATLLCRLVSKTLSEKSPKHATILDSFVGTSLVVAGKVKNVRIMMTILNKYLFCSFQLFGRIFQSSFGYRIKMGMCWS
jgi:hypothetical protein